MLPEQFDVLSWREILLVIRATDDVNREEWRRAATISTFVYNYAPRRKRSFLPRLPSQIFPGLFGRLISNYNKRMDAAIEQEKWFLEQVERKAQRLALEAEQEGTPEE